jgi:TetR/AcrR family transcriptional regulator
MSYNLTTTGGVTNTWGVRHRPHRARTEDAIRDPDRTRGRILRAATDLFTDVGPSAASLDDISRKAGVQRGLIYHYFKTKDALFDQVLARPFTEFLESHLEFLRVGTLDVDGLCEATAGFFRFLARHPELVRLLGWVMAMRHALRDLPQLEITRALLQRTLARLEEARASGALRADVDPAHLLITIIDLSIAWFLSRDEWADKLGWVDRDPTRLDEERLAAIVDLVRAAARPHAAG